MTVSAHAASDRLDVGLARRLTRALLAVMAVVLFGTVGFMWVEDWEFWHSLFFTLITITTVGYSDYGLSEAGERFATILLIGGIGVATYSAGQIVQSLVDYQLNRDRTMNKQIRQLSDHIIVCGLGRIGVAVCRRLAIEDVPFVGIDNDEKSVEAMVQEGFLAMVGDATEDSVLIRLGIARARGIACVTSSDPENIVITLSAREMNPDLLIISRAEEDSAARKIQRAGASRVISPIRTGGNCIAETILRPDLTELVERGAATGRDLELVELPIAGDSALDGVTVREAGTRHPAVVFVAIRRADGEPCIRPGADETLHAGDVLFVAADIESVSQMHQAAGGSPAAAA